MSGPRLSIIPAGAVTDRSLEPRDLQVLCLLGRHIDKAGWCVRSQVRMAGELACGRSSVQRSLERLVEAGWVEKKRRDQVSVPAEETQPSASYAYRVRLDRDDFAWSASKDSDDKSYAENADESTNCPPVGTPSDDENYPQGAQQSGHGGAQPYVGTGAQPYVGTNNDPLERPLSERERDARARDRQARGLVDFEARWPTAAADDRQRTAYAWAELSDGDREQALAGIGPFLEKLKRLGRKNVPAGWKYLDEKRWRLLDQPKQDREYVAQLLASDSAEAKAVAVIYRLAQRGTSLTGFMRAATGGLWYRGAITPQLLALADAPDEANYVVIDYRQAAAWNELIDAFVTVASRGHLRDGDRAPWLWPPRRDGQITAGAGPPNEELSDSDAGDYVRI